MNSNLKCAAFAWVIAWLLLPGAYVYAQTQPVAPARAAASSSTSPTPMGRFQLVPLPEGTMFLVDSVSGRVWRYSQLVPTEGDVRREAEAQVRAIDSSGRGIVSEEHLREVREQLRTKMNPCMSGTACFLEVDRVALTKAGGWQSEVIGR